MVVPGSGVLDFPPWVQVAGGAVVLAAAVTAAAVLRRRSGHSLLRNSILLLPPAIPLLGSPRFLAPLGDSFEFVRSHEMRLTPWIRHGRIDHSPPDREVRNFPRGFVERHDAAEFSPSRFAGRLALGPSLIRPAIDPLSDKNRTLAENEVDSVLRRLEGPRDKPRAHQVSRHDRFKDPVGVIKDFTGVRPGTSFTLVLLHLVRERVR